MSDDCPIVECKNLVKIYKSKEIEVVGLQGLDLTIQKGELMAIIGKSGSGKSTLLNIIAGLDRPSAGSIRVAGKDLLRFSDKELETYNRHTIGFVWQNNARNLLPYLSASMNVEVPMMITGRNDRRRRARQLLDMVGLTHRYDSKLAELSGGEQQRVAIAISLANNPQILLADEPTGSVDSKTAYMIMDVFKKINKELGITVIIVTHDIKLSKMVDRVVAINDGMIGSEMIKREDYNKRLTDMGDVMNNEESHDVFAVLDSKGRIRIPDEYLTKLDIKNKQRVRVRKSSNGFEVYIDS